MLAVSVVLLLAPPVAAQPVSDAHLDIETVSVVEEQNTTTVLLYYETSTTVKLSTYLFGSEDLQDTLVEHVGAEPEKVEFESLDTDSAELVYDGEADTLSVDS